MKSTIFWDITSHSPLEVNRRFGEHIASISRFYVDFLRHIAPKCRLTFNGLHDFMSKKVIIIITIIIIVIILSWASLSLLGTAATTVPLYEPQMIGDGDYGEIGGMNISRRN
jgi:hypothetical protein